MREKGAQYVFIQGKEDNREALMMKQRRDDTERKSTSHRSEESKTKENKEAKESKETKRTPEKEPSPDHTLDAVWIE